MTKKEPDVRRMRTSRQFLREVLGARKAAHPKFSLAYFSRRMGASESYLKLVVSGHRSLSPDRADALARALRLGPTERAIFLTLVLRDAAKTQRLRKYYGSILAEIRKLPLPYAVGRGFRSVFTDILAWEIYSLVGVDDFRPEPAWICAKLRRTDVAPEDVASCLDRLLSMGVLRRESDGRLKAQDIVMRHAEDLTRAYVVALERAIDHLRAGGGTEDGPSQFDSFCLIVSDEDFSRIKDVLTECKLRIADIVREEATGDSPRNALAFLNLNCFLATR